ncbi:putative type VI secretion system effector [Stenotrophomonas sp. NPDC077421]|uniref:putative type VI secretion system effector n=1 Tax=Stenotrophomonas sp. NPDC077421 TaxID=3414699 RepID=UPI003C2C23A6
MHKTDLGSLEVIHGKASNATVEGVLVNTLGRTGDREGMAATGIIAAAMGLSGAAAYMAASSVEDMEEPVAKVSVELSGQPVEGLLWRWPFKEGDQLTAIGNRVPGGGFVALAVMNEAERIIALYPHVSAGSHAHWWRVLRYSLAIGIPGIVLTLALVCIGLASTGENVLNELPMLLLISLPSIGICLGIGYSLGRRFTPYTRMAEAVFTAIGWSDVKWVNLRADVKKPRKPGDPPALGDSYFRY